MFFSNFNYDKCFQLPLIAINCKTLSFKSSYYKCKAFFNKYHLKDVISLLEMRSWRFNILKKKDKEKQQLGIIKRFQGKLKRLMKIVTLIITYLLIKKKQRQLNRVQIKIQLCHVTHGPSPLVSCII